MPSTDVDPVSQHVCYRRRVYWVVGWLVLIGLSMLADPWVASLGERLGHAVGPVKFMWVARIAKSPGIFYFTLVLAAIVLFIHPWKWRAGGLLCLSAMVGGGIYTILKWTVGRRRPSLHIPFEFSPFIGGWKGLLVSEQNLSFPSGHVTCAFATAAAMAVLYPRWRWAFYAVAAITGLERLAERAHYLSDVVAGAGVGILSVQISIYLAGLLLDSDQKVESACPIGQAEAEVPSAARSQ